MILPDYPIENKDQDQLKRFPLATKVAAMISAFAGKESFVIGVRVSGVLGKRLLSISYLDNSIQTVLFTLLSTRGTFPTKALS